MTDMVERVARAICASMGYAPDMDASQEFTNRTGPMWMAYIQEARAAIGAMREPTEAMVEAGAEDVASEYDDGKDQKHRETARVSFTSMITAALKEPPTC